MLGKNPDSGQNRMPAVDNNNPTWLKIIRAIGAPIPEAPLLSRASGPWGDEELSDVNYTYLGQGGFIDLALPGVHLHLYGKLAARPGRKMGHVTWVNKAP